MLDHLIRLVSHLGHWGYLIIFLGALLESAAFLGLVVPGESLVLLGGFLAAQGVLDVGDLLTLVAVGAIIGDSIGYELGRHFGRSWLLRHGRWAGLRARHFAPVDAFFEHHGGKTVFIGRFVGFLRALSPFVAGSSGMHYPRFLMYNVLGAVLWSVAFVLLGYFLGASWRLVEHWIGPASAILGGLLLLVIVLGWLWRWTIRHESDVKARWATLINFPRVLAFRRRYAPALEFLQARLSPSGYLGLRLTVGVLVILAAGWAFGGVAQDVLAGDPLTLIDKRVAVWLHEHATPSLTVVMRRITVLGSADFVAVAAALLGLVLAVRRRWYRLLELALTVPGGAVLNVLLKHVFRRPRPVFEHPLLGVTVHGYSFPSGHANAAMLLYGFLAFLIVQMVRGWRWRALVVLSTVFLIVLVDFSRMYLGLHYLSDVLGANAAGLAWLALVLTGVNTWERKRRLGAASGSAKRPEKETAGADRT
jgi:membrane protein DedA with SNARE-associated domain/membrane-associated phospholipid phosphatase